MRKARPNLSDARTVKVVVVGAGPAGAAVSLLLGRAGVSVLLVERESTFDRVFRGEGLMPSGADALPQMGLGGLPATRPNRVVEAWDIWMDGRLAFSIPEQSQQLGSRPMRVISQPALLASLIEEATRTKRSIGFTVSLFIAGLAFADEAVLNSAKLAILGATATAGALGYLYLLFDTHR